MLAGRDPVAIGVPGFNAAAIEARTAKMRPICHHGGIRIQHGPKMSRGKSGNNEAKKPKKPGVPVRPPVPAVATPGAKAVASLKKKKW